MSLSEAVASNVFGKIASKDLVDLKAMIMLHLFKTDVKLSDIKEFVSAKNIPFDTLKFQEEIRTNGTMLLGSKTYLYAYAMSRRGVANRLPERPPIITVKEAVALRTVYNGESKHSAKLRQVLAGYLNSGYNVLSVDEIRGMASEVLVDKAFNDYLGKFINRKMKFLYKSYGIEKDDIMSDLKRWVYYAIVRAYPVFKDAAHAICIAKTAAKNRGMNIIQENTASSRQRLIENSPASSYVAKPKFPATIEFRSEDEKEHFEKLLAASLLDARSQMQKDRTYSARNVSIHSLNESGVPTSAVGFTQGLYLVDEGGGVSSYSPLAVGLTGNRDDISDHQFELKRTFDDIVESDKFTVKQKYFVRLMLGEHDPEFSHFLGCNNEDYLHRNTHNDKYMNKLCSYLKVSQEGLQKFLSTLRGHIA